MPDRNATIQISQDVRGVMFRVSRGENPEGAIYRPLPLTPATLPPLTTRAKVIDYGTALTNALLCHPGVKTELERIFWTKDPDRVTLQFAIETPDGEPYRWETLLNDQQFLAVNGRISMKRIAYSGAAPGAALRVFALPLRMIAFLSPSGVSSADEFNAIANAVGEAHRQGLQIEATIYLGEQGLLDEKRRAVAANELPGISVEPIPDSAIGLETVLLARRAQIVHFFCHGFAGEGVQRLEFASITDNDTGSPTGSIAFSAERLNQALLTSGTAWLTVLSSCSSATQAPTVFSMAASLAQSGSPVAIGMAEPIRSGDASLFAQQFYGPALRIIEQALAGLLPGSTTRIDFGPAVDVARKALYDVAAGEDSDYFARWSQPVLYQRDAPLKVGLVPDDAMRERIAVLAQSLRTLPSSTPAALRNVLLGVLDKPPAVPPALRPDPFGEFS